jgi:hypothetical protein
LYGRELIVLGGCPSTATFDNMQSVTVTWAQ